MFHDRWLLEHLVHCLESEGRNEEAESFRDLIAEAIHPLAKRGWGLGAASADALAPRLLGGAGPVMRTGERSALGPTRAHQAVHVHITTACIVTLELWMPFATMACGRWPVRGPGSTTIFVVPNETLGGPDLVRPVDLGVIVAHGREGEFPTWITFAP